MPPPIHHRTPAAGHTDPALQSFCRFRRGDAHIVPPSLPETSLFMNQTAITHLAEDPVVLKLDDCADWAALHDRIRKTFGFPAYYGRNWDAMWDCLRDVYFPAVPAASLWRA